jgi:catechol 2,3-dioxygenase-like lactoylglutathione lyase family enzyme
MRTTPQRQREGSGKGSLEAWCSVSPLRASGRRQPVEELNAKTKLCSAVAGCERKFQSICACSGEDSSVEEVNSWRMAPAIERISAVTFRVANMAESVRFYRDVLGMELLYGGEDACFSSLRARDAQSAILNLERGDRATRWGRLIFYVTDVDAFWTHLKERGFNPEIPRDAPWGERYFHVPDPDGHELSFARPLE